ncbi:MAG: Spy/CpxP family protein refolding chaperone [Acetobacteraceae bacterium]|nr:Spy/CpxP family protein refolding chaperone [Acetobacteraceae bacterium]
MFRPLPAALLAAMALPLAAASAPHSPYAGEKARDIMALSARDVADLLAGRGMGMARAAELNGHPGPMHVLELRDRLGLAPEQEAAVRASFARMEAAAKPLGAELVERERALDRAFAGGAVTTDRLRSMAAAIGEVQGRLRAVHLAAHVETRAILTDEQVRAYDALRGYSRIEGAPERQGGGQHGRPH